MTLMLEKSSGTQSSRCLYMPNKLLRVPGSAGRYLEEHYDRPFYVPF